MTKTIAITGATGFAGRHAVRALLARGHRVKALVRDPKAAQLPKDVTAIAGDLHSRAALRELSEGADAVLHLAGAVAAKNREGFFAVNAEGTAWAVEAARQAGVKRFVHVSSLAAREPQLSPYGASKAASEEAVSSARNISTIILRPPAIYGPGDKATLPLIRELTRPVAMIPSTAAARFSLIHAGDFARIAVAALEDLRDGLVELSDGKPGGYGWQELCAISEAHEGYRVRPVFLPRAVTDLVAGVSEGIAGFRGVAALVNRGKVAELYHPDWVSKGEGWALESPTSFDKGFAETIAWYRKQGWLPPGRPTGTSRPNAHHETRS